MNTAVMFSKASDEWATPDDCFAALHREFKFTRDVAATNANKKVAAYYGPDHVFSNCRDALTVAQWQGVCWMNPPYSRCRAFVAKAAEQARGGVTVVALVPSRTDTRWWHEHVWDGINHRPRPGVEVRFHRGRLKFGEGKNSAPFPSVVIIFRPS